MTDRENSHELNRLRWIEQQVRDQVFSLREDAREARLGLIPGLSAPSEFADGLEEAARNLEDILEAAPPQDPPLDREQVIELRESMRKALAALDVMVAAPPGRTTAAVTAGDAHAFGANPGDSLSIDEVARADGGA